MNKYQEALDRLKSIDLDILLDKLDYDVACDISVYGIHDYPMLEMDGDIKTIQELVDKETPKKVKIKRECLRNGFEFDRYFCPSCDIEIDILETEAYIHYCRTCGQKLDWSE